MNDILLDVMEIVAFIVTIMGGGLFLSLLLYAIYRLFASIWERTSNAAKHTKEYLKSRYDFELYKKDVARWDEYQRQCIEKCQRCKYLEKYMEENSHDE